ncbi:MAG: ribosome biogenesis GTPase Der [Planctomycetes bacterium]|nr:ribosome biogenesis GTPase Der [Planctomycetota bacterium]
MSLPTIAIVGRPNVGKSSYLNAVVGRRVSIVEPTPGVTRDRVTVEVEHGDRRALLMDTGGIGVVDEMRLDQDIEHQIELALDIADVLIFVVDGREGVTPLDQRVARRLRKLEKPVILAANKLDHPGKDILAAEFYRLGMGEVVPLSAQEGIGVMDLLDRAFKLLPEPEGMTDFGFDPEVPRIALVGKRNVGKSTFINQVAGTERVIVSDIAGTTRDAVDVPVDYKGRRFIAIDTAGIMKKNRVGSSIDFYSQARSEAAIRRADIILFLIDPATDLSQVDKKIAMQVVEQGKPCVLVINKWDSAGERISTEEYMEYLELKLPGLHFAPVVFISAREGFNVDKAIDVAFDLHRQAQLRVGTGELNRVLEAAFERRRPGGKTGYKAKIFYGTQVDRSPPTFVVFVNDPSLFPGNYQRYVENRLREAFKFDEIPVQVFFRSRDSLYHD